MPTLANFQGSSIVPDLTNLDNLLLQTFGTAQSREKERLATEKAATLEEERLAKQAGIQEQIGILSQQAPGVDPGFASTAEGDAAQVARAAEQARLTKQHQQRQQQAFIRLSGLDPQIAGAVKDALQRGDKIELAQINKQTDEGIRIASQVLKEKNPAKQKQLLLQIAKVKAAQGEDPRRTVDLLNMPSEKLQVALRKMEVAGKDIKTLVTPQEQFTTEIRDGVPVQISSTTGKEIVSPRAVKPVAAVSGISKPSPKDFTGESLDKFNKSGNFSDLEMNEATKKKLEAEGSVKLGENLFTTDPQGNIFANQVVVGGDGKALVERIPIKGKVVAKQTGQTAEEKSALDIKTAGGKEEAKLTQTLKFTPSIESVKARTKGKEARLQTSIATGLDKVQALPIINRSIQLLDSIPTGGIDQAKLKIKQFFGIEGADEAELSANLGKAVMSQLRTVFGAAFTEKEGQSLARIEAGFGKSAEGNKRLLRQTKKLITTVVNRSIKDAVAVGDFRSAAEMKEMLELNLDPNAPDQDQPGGTPQPPPGFEVQQ